MIELWPHWQRPAWLLLLPLLGWLLWQLWHRERRSGRWELLLPRTFQPWLLTGRRHHNRLPWLALGLAWLLALLALLGPSWQRIEHNPQKRADPLVVLLELTPSMLASDIAPSRLEQAKRKLRDLLDARRDAQTAIVVYAGSAHSLVPLSDDMMTSLNLIDALNPSIMPEQGHRADLAVAKALTLLEQGAQGQGRLLLITSGLTDREQTGIRSALGANSQRLAILGIGTAAGAPIAQKSGGFLKDDQGAILLPKLDDAQLRRFAADLGGHYTKAHLDDDDLHTLRLLGGPQSLRESGEITRLDVWADQGHWLLLPLLLIAACAGRRGWLFCLPLLLVLPRPSLALEFDDLWLRPDQQGQRLLKAQRPAEAAQHFSDPRWQGTALYQAGDYAQAATHFAQGNSAQDHYNRGNALAKAGELEAAIDAYDCALEREPQLSVAKHNKALLEELLRQRQEPPADQPNPQQPQPRQTAQNSEREARQQTDSPENDESGTRQDPGENAQSDPTHPASDNSAETTTAPPPAPPQTASVDPLGDERRQALEQWLRQIPDDPAELLRRKFWYEQQQRREDP